MKMSLPKVNLAFLPLVIITLSAMLFLPTSAQNFQIKKEVIDNAGGAGNSPNFSLKMAVAQPQAIGKSQSPNFKLSAGLLPEVPPPMGIVLTEALCTSEVLQGCNMTVQIKVDMSSLSSPDSLLGIFFGSITWDPALLHFVSHTGLLSGFAGLVTVDTTNALITFNGTNILGMGGLINIMEVNFQVVGPVGNNGTVDLDFNVFQSIFLTDLLQFLNINDCFFSISQADLMGDVNGDNQANSTDGLIILSYDAGLTVPPQFLDRINSGLGDVNSDGHTNSTDVLILLSFDVGVPVPFPVGDPVCP